VRLTGVVAALAILAAGQFLDTNDPFPLGSLSQYASARDMDGTIQSVYLTADTDEARDVRIPLNQSVVGVGRAEIEGQLRRILAQPSLLQSLADAHAELKPDQPALRELRLMRSEQQLSDGYVVGEPTVEELARWTVTEVGS
jgi:hypothetical protein